MGSTYPVGTYICLRSNPRVQAIITSQLWGARWFYRFLGRDGKECEETYVASLRELREEWDLVCDCGHGVETEHEREWGTPCLLCSCIHTERSGE